MDYFKVKYIPNDEDDGCYVGLGSLIFYDHLRYQLAKFDININEICEHQEFDNNYDAYNAYNALSFDDKKEIFHKFVRGLEQSTDNLTLNFIMSNGEINIQTNHNIMTFTICVFTMGIAFSVFINEDLINEFKTII